ncbi:MAG: glycosyltransferase, partial [Pseudonocardiales bacterium]|nr:glycosyltransferase [Pseudonocardiales bacterium]
MTDARVALVLGTSAGGVGVHVLSLARRLVSEGWPVTVCAPGYTHEIFDFPAVGASVSTVPIR